VEHVPAAPRRSERLAQGPDAFREHEGPGHDDARLLREVAMGTWGVEAHQFNLDRPAKVLEQLERLQGNAPALAQVRDG